MGVGGGFIMVPVMVYMLRMPMHVVVGTSLFQILFTCVNVTIMQASQNHTVDFILALLLLIGSALGAQVGAKLGKKKYALYPMEMAGLCGFAPSYWPGPGRWTDDSVDFSRHYSDGGAV